MQNPYPFFDIKSIEDRCADDIKQYKEAFPGDFDAKLSIDENAKTLESLKNSISGLITMFKEISRIDLNKFDYPHGISKFEVAVQNKIWILRTYMFYQLLIFATMIMSNKELFDDVYKNQELVPKRTFRPDITVDELKNYKMGIFGSLTPTSDIDIGIQYSGSNTELNGLSYVVSIFEDLFLIFLGISSLKLDIETYADMMTIPNQDPATKVDSPDLFYLDTSNFSLDNFKSILPYAGASIVRNYVTAKLSLKRMKPEDTLKEIDNFQITNTFIIKNDRLDLDLEKSLGSDKDGIEIMNALRLEEWQNESKELVKGYLTDYATSREEYYKLVDIAEKSTEPAKKITGVLPPNEIAEIIKKIGKALIYRAESHTCAPTVMHVVRVMQAGKKNPEKYKTITPEYCSKKGLTEVLCDIGKYGYIISMLEQIGFIYRFDITYCQPDGHPDPEKCLKKMNKYKERYDNAVIIYNSKKSVLEQITPADLKWYTFDYKNSVKFPDGPKPIIYVN